MRLRNGEPTMTGTNDSSTDGRSTGEIIMTVELWSGATLADLHRLGRMVQNDELEIDPVWDEQKLYIVSYRDEGGSEDEGQ